MIKNKYAAFALLSAICLLICNGLDYLYATFVTESGYRFTPADDLLIPLAVSIVIGYFIIFKKKPKKNAES